MHCVLQHPDFDWDLVKTAYGVGNHKHPLHEEKKLVVEFHICNADPCDDMEIDEGDDANSKNDQMSTDDVVIDCK